MSPTSGIPLTVCPWSNIVIANRFASLEEHPFRAMRDAGLRMTVNTDDPAMMSWDLGREYQALGEAQGFDVAELGRIAVEGIASTWLDAPGAGVAPAGVRDGARRRLDGDAQARPVPTRSHRVGSA